MEGYGRIGSFLCRSPPNARGRAYRANVGKSFQSFHPSKLEKTALTNKAIFGWKDCDDAKPILPLSFQLAIPINGAPLPPTLGQFALSHAAEGVGNPRVICLRELIAAKKFDPARRDLKASCLKVSFVACGARPWGCLGLAARSSAAARRRLKANKIQFGAPGRPWGCLGLAARSSAAARRRLKANKIQFGAPGRPWGCLGLKA
jgi:hypothetical protein